MVTFICRLLRLRRPLFNLFLFVAVNFRLTFLVVCLCDIRRNPSQSTGYYTFAAAILHTNTHTKRTLNKRIGAYRYVCSFWRNDLLFSFTCATSVLLLYNIPYPTRWRWRRYIEAYSDNDSTITRRRKNILRTKNINPECATLRRLTCRRQIDYTNRLTA